ncbi:hypothetical protein [Paraliomyxa miuraensis]|uniref:hypothetical protein n=1 Tax=Paraliomyxa miuraensis TaxID=376150 RepID=UPI00224E7DA6|nr:hypothetical protein [Paraliomyxa miuraensis]MCX4246501.1 hypothetical protein [Paraliomyxa miuraensis]
MEALLSDHRELQAANSEAFEALFLEYGIVDGVGYGALAPEHRPRLGRRDKQEILRDLAFGSRAFEQLPSGKLREREPSYYDWLLPESGTIAVPLSAGMTDVLERGRRWEAIEEDVQDFEDALGELADHVIALRKALCELAEAGQQGLHEVAMLVSLSQYCDLLLDQEGNPEPGESPLADLQEFMQRSAIPVFMDKLVREPVDLAPGAAKRRDAEARRIIKRLADPAFVAGVGTVVCNHDVVPHPLLDSLYYYLTAAADLLSMTPLAEEFAERHALPLYEALAGLPDDGVELPLAKLRNDVLREAIEGGWRSLLEDRESVYKLAMGIGTGVIGSVSNLAGPRSVGVAVLMQYQIYLFRRGAKEYASSVVVMNRAVQSFMRYFTTYNAHSLAWFRGGIAEVAFGEGKLTLTQHAKKCGFDMTRGPFSGRVARSTMALMAVSVLGLALAARAGDEEVPVSSTLALVATGGTAGVALIDWPPVARALEGSRWSVMLKHSGGLAALTGAFGVASSLMALVDAGKDGDALGIAEGALSFLGSSSSLIGWYGCTQMGALAFAPSLLMTVGSILVLAGLGVGLWRVLKPMKPIDVVNVTLEYFRSPESRASLADLGPTLDTLDDLVELTDFLPLTIRYEPALRGLGYDDEIISILLRG